MKYPIPRSRPPMPVQTMGRPLQNAQGLAPQPTFMQRLGEMSPALLQASAGLLSGRTGPEQFALGAQGFGQGAQGIAEKREADLKKNKTFQWLEKNATPEELEAVRAGLTTATDLFKAKTSQTAQKPTTAIQNFEYAQNNPAFAKYLERTKGGVTVHTGNQNPMPGLGKLDGDYTYLYNPDGTVKIDEQGLPMIAPIPGGPADVEAQKVEQANQNKQEMQRRTSDIVLDDIRRAKDIIKDGGFFNGTGLTGTRPFQMMPGTDAHRLSSKLQTIRANAGFDKLQQMRDASPTGGALGQVSERELSFLQAAIGDLDQSQTQEDLLYNLERVERIYTEIVHGPQAAGSEDFSTMSDAELRAIANGG